MIRRQTDGSAASPMRATAWAALVAVLTLAWSPAAFAGTAGTRLAERTGDQVQILLPAGALAATLVLRDWEGTAQHTKGFLLNLGATTAIKLTLDSPRPGGNGGQSFPSGHTSAAFQGASFIQKRYGWKVGVPSYVAATYVGWSRVVVHNERHHWSDVAAGAALGVLSSYAFTTPQGNVTVAPMELDGGVGVRLNIEW